MATQPAVKLTPNAAKRTAQAVRLVLNAPIDLRGKFVPPVGGGANLILAKITGGGTNGIYPGVIVTGQCNGSSGTTLTGTSTGANVIVYNGPELGTSPSEPYIGNAANTYWGYFPCMPIGVDASTGKQILMIAGVSIAC